jgi:hypothetical protein
MQTVCPNVMSSASAGPVRSVSSGVPPASEIPGIAEVMVLPTVHVNVPLFPHILKRISLAAFSLPAMRMESGISRDVILHGNLSIMIIKYWTGRCGIESNVYIG